MKRVAILGSTGSIGQQAVDVIRDHRDRFQLAAVSAHQQVDELARQVDEFAPAMVCVTGPAPPTAKGWLTGADGLLTLIEESSCDVVLNALTGAAGLAASVRAVELGLVLAVANKESLVMAGPLILEIARRTGAAVIPVDSEHSAILQCLRAGDRSEVRRIWLTASGGPFRGWTAESLRRVTVEEALRHPTWNMGPKITIDSATLMNKALEIIETTVLFDVDPRQVEVVVHPQSAVHSLVEFRDGSLVAHLGDADMRIPIQYALTQPERWSRPENDFSLVDLQVLHFEAPDSRTFPSIDMAYRVCEAGGTLPAVFNAANEVAVKSFLEGRIEFPEIFALVERALDQHHSEPATHLEQIFAVDRDTREIIQRWTS